MWPIKPKKRKEKKRKIKASKKRTSFETLQNPKRPKIKPTKKAKKVDVNVNLSTAIHFSLSSLLLFCSQTVHFFVFQVWVDLGCTGDRQWCFSDRLAPLFHLLVLRSWCCNEAS